MKFEIKYPDTAPTERIEFEYSFVTRDPKLGQCFECGSFTRWIDVKLQKHVCSEECGNKIWRQAREHSRAGQLDEMKKEMEAELKAAVMAENKWKDIIIVVRDQLEYFKQCIESVRAHTHNYTLYIWDNDSGPETKQYIERLQAEFLSIENPDWSLEVWTMDANMGFIEPNNRLAEVGTGDYIILLNSDTKVFEHWDTAMLGFLQNNPDYRQVGFWGGHLSSDGRGFGGDNGAEIDYIPGWCFCIERKTTYAEFGLFNKQLKFAYCEDADLSLRLMEAGHKIYALYIPLVYHYQNKTINEVHKEGQIDVQATFEHNHRYIMNRWKEYLETKRVLLNKGTDSNEISELSQHSTG